MLNNTPGITDSSFLDLVNNNVAVQAVANITKAQTSSHQVVMDGTFCEWLEWKDKKLTGTAVQPIPAGKAKTDGTMGKAPPLLFNFRLKKANEVEDLSTRTEAGFSVKARVLYDKEKYDKRERTTKPGSLPAGHPTVKEVLTHYRNKMQQGLTVDDTNRLSVETLLTPEGELQKFVWKTFSEGAQFAVTFFNYTDDARAVLNKKRANGSPALQSQAPLRLENVDVTLRAETYRKKDDPFATEELDHWAISVNAKNYNVAAGRINIVISDKTLSEQMHANYNKFAVPDWVPYGLIQSGQFVPNKTVYFYIHGQYQSPDGRFMRASLNNLLLSDFEFKDKDGALVQKYKWSLMDGIRVGDQLQRYAVNIVGGQSKYTKDVLATWGIPDVKVSGRLWHANNGFPCHVVAGMGVKRMAENDHNSTKTDAERAAMNPPILGVYEFYANEVVPDFHEGLPLYGIPLTKERVVAEFLEAAKIAKDKKQPRYYEEHKDEDDRKISKFKNFFPGAKNLVNSDGPDGAVVNLGYGERPALECSDTGSMLQDMDWFALTSIAHADLQGQLQTIAGDKTKGVAFFDMLKTSPGAKDPENGFAYQIFGIRNRIPEVAIEQQVNEHGKKEHAPSSAGAVGESEVKRVKKAGAKK